VHEPQEELAFYMVLKEMPKQATMLELGAYWSFYSLWFHKSVHSPKCFLVEPLLSNFNYGKKNFSINGCTGNFTNAYVGRSSGLVNGNKQICVDKFLKEKEIDHLNILHSDIQGYEVEMLHGADKSLSARIIDYIFISTHSNQLHDQCINLLESKDYLILASANLDESFARDGVIVARRKEMKGLDCINITLR
ncbi:MAG: FkbM family methyltransferase, partial [Moorea sp. SIO4G2]|nr:FkbM family methyltransferase [Moorena sp. SIO4G2]